MMAIYGMTCHARLNMAHLSVNGEKMITIILIGTTTMITIITVILTTNMTMTIRNGGATRIMTEMAGMKTTDTKKMMTKGQRPPMQKRRTIRQVRLRKQ